MVGETGHHDELFVDVFSHCSTVIAGAAVYSLSGDSPGPLHLYPLGRSIDDAHELEQLGADFEGGTLEGFEVEVQGHAIVDHPHVDHEPGFRAALAITDGQHRGGPQEPEQVWSVGELIGTDVQLMAVGEVRIERHLRDQQAPLANHFSIEGFQLSSQGARSEHTDGHRGVLIGKRRRRPFDELGEVVEERRFQ